MNKFKALKTCVQAVVAVVVTGGLGFSLCSAEPPASTTAAATTNYVAAKAGSPAAGPAGGKKQITGAELYSIHCNRCHPERYPTERTAAQWKTIMLHMQVRASIPGSQARLILQYLQENSGR